MTPSTSFSSACCNSYGPHGFPSSISPHSHRPALMGSSNLRSNSVCEPSDEMYGFLPPRGLASKVAPRRQTSASPRSKSSNSSAYSSQSSAGTVQGIEPPTLSTNSSFSKTTLELDAMTRFCRSKSGCTGVVSRPSTAPKDFSPFTTTSAHSLGCTKLTSIMRTSSSLRISSPHTAASFAASASHATTLIFVNAPLRMSSLTARMSSATCSPRDTPITISLLTYSAFALDANARASAVVMSASSLSSIRSADARTSRASR